jgi:phage repressor protein C with HTH and peptisase S24 domain
MEPTLKVDMLVLTQKVYRSTKLKPQDMIVYQSNNGEYHIKRISAINGHQYLVLGDNPSDSLDSRSLGPINREHIIGKVIWY